ncbi:PilW family protein [Pseudomonas sp. 30_B]|uniref:PilW family protein n=1 Tax=Pseudomonas sp. 30_B TaxID=2813575 RepID=UPI001A9FF65B|nr:PilW family protein [Pseudomonas sp. 30_B]
MPVTNTGQRGFSMIEVMIAMALGLVILLAVTVIFTNNSRTRSEMEKSGRQVENGRYALTLLSDEISNAGFWGEAGTQNVPATLPPLCPLSAAEVSDALGVPVQGGSVSGSAPSCISTAKSASDYLAIRRASTCATGSSGCDAFVADYFHLQVSACATKTPGVPLVKTVAADLTAKKRDCTTAAPIYRLLSRVYFISGADVLSRVELENGVYSGATQLVEGIEQLHFEYGLDTAPVARDGAVDLFTATPTATQWPDVVAIRIWLVARNLEKTPGYVDGRTYQLGGSSYSVPTGATGYKREVYSTTVYLNNVSGRRQAP